MQLASETTSPHTPQKVQRENCTLTVLSLLREGLHPSEIWKNHGISERNVKYILKKLKSLGLVKKLGYGTWEVLEGVRGDSRRCKIVHRVGTPPTPLKVQEQGAKHKPDSVRGHGIVATIKIPKFANWDERATVLRVREIPFTDIPQGQRIRVGSIEKCWLTSRSIVFYYPKGYSWFGETAQDVAGAILEDVILHARKLERLLGIDTLKVRGFYRVKFSRQHYSLIRNGLARMYNDPRRKLGVRDDGGLWLLIDNSYNLEELETVHKETARPDNKTVQDFFNGLKQTPITPQEVLRLFAETTTQIKEINSQAAYFAKHFETHVGAVNSLSRQAEENAKTTVSLREAVSRLSETVQGLTIPPELKARLPEKAVKRLEKRASEPAREIKVCALCGAKTAIPAGRDLCDECVKIVREHKRPTQDSSLGEYT